LRFSSIGDIVMTTPTIRCLKQQVPGAVVHFATKTGYRFLVESNPYVDKVFGLDDSIPDLARQLDAENYDAVIDLHNNLRTWRLGRAMKPVPTYRFDKLNLKKYLLTAFKINVLPKGIHASDRFLATVAHFGVKNDGRGQDFFIPPADEVSLQLLPETHRRGYVAYAIGAQQLTRQLPLPKMIELCGKIQRPLVLMGGTVDEENGKAIAEALNTPLIFNATGKFNFNQSASLLRQADLVYAHDTGLAHVAAALKKRVVFILGNTVISFGMYPYATEKVIWEVNGLWCRPCSKIGYTRCPLRHHRCMNDQKLDVVAMERETGW
ncbi:MAG: glycosyltransferase family 9 protein, partial [Sphingobacteriaceae bacterium]|nr:glycosyltransferase family 9 protein [Cytophagaceae bacterium]